ncbi:MAG TPA: SDR family NAD(P)-dependent oxidoreductase [Pyrinomonadaceae bacterium]|nr:SDR family NAD(P)-dependent oxidoreductase [Pyrinomonadaceae bacterium]
MDSYKRKVREILDLVRSNRVCPLEGHRLIRELRAGTSGNVEQKPVNGDEQKPAPVTASIGDNLIAGEASNTGSSPFQAVVLTRPGGIADIQIREIFPREPQPNQVQILVKAFSINFGALLCVKGLYPTMPDYPFTPGFEVSGVAIKVGSAVQRVRAGDEVIGLGGVEMGGHGAVINVNEGAVVKKPANVSHVEACAFPIVFMTMQRGFELARIKKGEKVLIQTAAGGTGLISVQLAQLLEAEVFATAGSQEKLDYLARMGVRNLINYREEDFAKRVLEMTGNYGVDVVFNTLSGDAIQKGLAILAPGGRYVELAMTGLKTANNISLSSLDNNQVFYSVDLRKQLLQKPELAGAYLDEMVQTLAAGKIRSIVGKVFPFSEVRQAYQFLADRKNVGKVVVTMPEIALADSPSAETPYEISSAAEEQAPNDRTNDVAIIGIAGRFPGAKNVNEFWQNLAAGKSSIVEVPGERWDINAHYDPDHRVLNKTHCRWGGFLSDIDQFDPVFFNLSGREAQLTDPQQRLFLEESWTALEDAGYATERIANTRCGVFVGVGQSDYIDKMIEEGLEREAQSFWGNDPSVLTARLSYFLNLKGATMAINSACSSSLVAIHLACQSILSGESEVAIAGGAFLRTLPTFHIMNSNAAMLSPEGKCMTFDNRANGFVPGEGVGVVVLKSLPAALRDGDHIYGVVRSSGTNQDGRTNGITAPSTISQTELELAVYRKGNINPETISFVEAHGTGTKLGDPIEIEALTNAFRKYTDKKQYCAIGSVKTNIGHSVAAAGIAGVMKVLLALKHKQIPASLNFEQSNEHINFDDSPFFVNTSLKEWESANNQPRRAAVSSFGFSGTNAHLVIEEAPAVKNQQATASAPAFLFPVSAKTESALIQKITELLSWLDAAGRTQRLQDIACTLQVGRSHFPVRAITVAGSVEELRDGLSALQRKDENPSCLFRNLKENPSTHESAQKRLGQERLRKLAGAQLSEQEFRAELLSLAALYVNGYDLDWTDFFAEKKCRRVSLPTYPFARQRYWIPSRSKETTVAPKTKTTGHPLLGSVDSESSLEQQGIVFRQTLAATHPIASHHQVQNQSIVPGVGHLELAYAALSQIRNSADCKLADVVWLHPLNLTDGDKDVSVSIRKEEERLHFEVRSKAGEETVIHSRGEFRTRTAPSGSSAERIDIDAIKARCKAQSSGGQKPFHQLQALGICYGTFFQALTQLWSGADEALGQLELPSEHQGDFGQYLLHPTIMDGALQATIGLTGAPRSGQPVLPFSVEEVELIRPLSNRSYAYITPGQRSLQFDVTIVDETGLVTARIRNVAFRELPDPLQKLFYIPTWKYEPLVPESVDERESGQVLIVHSHDGSELANVLANSHRNQEVVKVLLGSFTKQLAPDSWEVDVEEPSALEQCARSLKDIRTVYFLGGIQAAEPDPADLEALDQSQEAGVISLFRLSKALLNSGYGTKALTLKVVTNDASETSRGATLNPYAASLAGFCKSLARERSGWEVSCLDVSFGTDEEVESLAHSIIIEPALRPGEEIAIRNGARCVQKLVAFDLPPVSQLPFRKQGVYFILGGAGGIGIELSRYLAETVNANLVLVGRTALSDELQKKIAQIEAGGANVLYVQADATNPRSLNVAVQKAKQRFGRIDGVIHSAIVLNDMTVESMDEQALRSVLAPKVKGAAALFAALQYEQLDFMLFFSSAQSICGNPGQSNYAAACTFKDAYAHYLRRNVNYPVKILNWGYWGEVGIVATEEHQRRLTSQGIYSITPREGMETVKRMLGSTVTQIMPIKAKPELLVQLGVDSSQRAEFLKKDQLPSVGAIDQFSKPALDVDRVNRALDGFKQLDRFARELLLAAFQREGVFQRGGETYELDTLKRQLRITPGYASLFAALLDILENAGAISVTGGKLTVDSSVENIINHDPDHGLRKKQRLLETLPELTPHIDLLWACAQHWLEILRGEVSGTDVLFPDSSTEKVEGIYKGNILVDYFNQLVVWNLKSYIEMRLTKLPAGEKINILEIGAGTGGTSTRVFEALSPFAEQLRYHYTDISASFTQFGKRQFGAANPYVEFRVLDIERDVENQGYAPGTFDAVIATNVLHATKQIKNTLANAKTLLKSQGWLIVNEVTAAQDFTTLTFGLLDGWWLFQDHENRLEHSPLIGVRRWQRLLNEQGFERVVNCGISLPGGDAVAQNVIVAQSDGLIVRSNVRTTSAATAGQSEKKRSPKLSTTSVSTADSPAPASTVNRQDLRSYVEAKVIESFAAVLQLSEEVFDRDTPHSDYGVDSLLAVDIINKLNEVPGINLRSTDLFNYATVGQLTDHIIEECEAELRRVVTPDTHEVETPTEPVPEPLSERVDASRGETRRAPDSDVAIIGISGFFPEAENVYEFWKNLSSGKNSIQNITRWEESGFYDPDPSAANKSYSKWGGMLSEIHHFDPTFFSISPREAELMDPQQRLFLQETWRAVEDAGYSDKELAGKNCSVFVGCGPGDYNVKLKEHNVPLEAYSFTGNSSSILAARISYLLNLKGPSVPVDTACSSSLVAIHLACENIRNGVSEMAIVGGVAVMNTPDFHILGSRGGMLSPVGQCKTFDDDADGFVPGEAVGALVLKNLSAARRDGDHIYGVISGSAINQDGKTNGITAPSAPAQTALECEVYDRFHIDPAEITYIEAHGTGTRLGDPIEVQALTDAFRRYTSETQYCALGSVKTNIGHTLTAAGIASVIKVLLSMQHRQLPPSLNYTQPNRHIDFARSPFYVNTRLQPWTPANGSKRQAAVSSFGFSGTNAHLVLSEADDAQPRAADHPPSYLFVLSAQTSTALSQKVAELSAWLDQAQPQPLLRDVTYTLQLGRSHFTERVAIVAGTLTELNEKLQALGRSEQVPDVYRTAAETGSRKRNKAGEERGAQLLSDLTQTQATAERRTTLSELAQLFVQSCELDWAQLYKTEDHRRLSMPTYPFAREYFWVPQPEKPAHTEAAAFDLKVIERDPSEELQFTTRLTGREFFTRDHQIENQKVLPGVAYLELARSAAELAGGRKVATLKNVLWTKPLTIETDPCELSINLRHSNDAVIYDVWTATDKQQRVSYAQGELTYRESSLASAPDKVDIEEIRRRCAKVVSGDSCYEEFRTIGFDYGPSFRVIQELSYNENEVFACLALPSSRCAELKDFVLHPSLLDGALQSGLWLMDRQTLAETRYLPFAIAEVQIREALPPVCYVHVRESIRKTHLRKFNIRILDESGKVLVEIIDYTAKAQSQTAQRKVKLALTAHPFEGRSRMVPEMISDDVIRVFRSVEAGELDVTRAHMMIQQLTTSPSVTTMQAPGLATLTT